MFTFRNIIILGLRLLASLSVIVWEGDGYILRNLPSLDFLYVSSLGVL